MPGTIRFLLGILVTFGAVGGLETNESIVGPVVAAVVGLAFMYSGTRAMRKHGFL